MNVTKVSNPPRNPGIVPPWLTQPVKGPGMNPGIVPPWLTGNAGTPTTFVREAASISPDPLTAAVRAAR